MGAVNACVSDTYRVMRDAAVAAVLDYADEEGLRSGDLTRLLNAVPEAESETFARLHVEVVEATRDRIEEKGYSPAEIATKLPSTRRKFVERFMNGRELVSLQRLLSMLEACGLRAELVIAKDDKHAPSKPADSPRERYRPLPPSHYSRGIYRPRREVHRLKAAVLNAWAAGASRQECADVTGIALGYVSRIITVARQQDDPRARRRRAPNQALAANDDQPVTGGCPLQARAAPLPPAPLVSDSSSSVPQILAGCPDARRRRPTGRDAPHRAIAFER